MKKTGKVFLWIFAVIGVFFTVLIGGSAVFMSGGIAPSVPKKSLIVVDLGREYLEKRKEDFLPFQGEELTFLDLTWALKKAENDHRVKAVLLKTDGLSLNTAQTEEIRKQLVKITKAGKKTYSFGSSYPSLRSYYLATGAEMVAIQPTGDVAITGLRMEVPFFKTLLAKIGIKPAFDARYEYKSGPAQWTENKFTAAQKENMNRLASQMFDHMTARIRETRPKFDKSMIDIAPFTGKEAEAVGLVDLFAYDTGFIESINKNLETEEMDVESYIAAVKAEDSCSDEVAVITLSGTILSGRSAGGDSSDSLYDKDVHEIASHVAANKNIKAVVVRIDSPGGGFQASDVIYQVLTSLKEQKFPLVVSMGGSAASGGYYISLPADKIFADELTLTGSVGVYGGKFVLAEVLEKVGIKVDKIYYGKNAGIYSLTSDFSPNERRAFAKMLDAVYETFTAKVNEHRKVEIDKVARGRVFTGKDARENGLVDSIASLEEVIIEAAKMAKLKKYKVVEYPKAEESWSALFKTVRRLSDARRKLPIGIEALLKQAEKLETQDLRLLGPSFEIR